MVASKHFSHIAGSPCTCIGVGLEIPFFLSPDSIGFGNFISYERKYMYIHWIIDKTFCSTSQWKRLLIHVHVYVANNKIEGGRFIVHNKTRIPL